MRTIRFPKRTRNVRKPLPPRRSQVARLQQLSAVVVAVVATVRYRDGSPGSKPARQAVGFVRGLLSLSPARTRPARQRKANQWQTRFRRPVYPTAPGKFHPIPHWNRTTAKRAGSHNGSVATTATHHVSSRPVYPSVGSAARTGESRGTRRISCHLSPPTSILPILYFVEGVRESWLAPERRGRLERPFLVKP